MDHIQIEDLVITPMRGHIALTDREYFKMIDFYTFKTPNGRKVAVALEELGLPYRVHSVDISKGEQFEPAFLKISPNNKIPAIVDHNAPDGALSIFESGAILIYLAEKAESDLLPTSGVARAKTLEWLMFQMGGVGPMFGQLGHFTRAAPEKVPYAINRFKTEADRLLKVMDTRLAETPYLAGDAYSIADITTYPWLDYLLKGITPRLDEVLFDAPNIAAWLERVGAREAVQRGMKIPA
jgi:GST-like protein